MTIQERRVLSMECDRYDESLYRIQIGSQIKYLFLQAGTFEYDKVMIYPPALMKALPPFPKGDWTTMFMSRTDDQKLVWNLSYDPLPAVESTWHPMYVDILSLPEVKGLNPRVRQVQYGDRRVIAKIARFDWEVQYVERESWAYQQLSGTGITPAFLGHLTEEGRVMGFLLENFEGRFAGIDDLEACERLTKRMHEAGLVHGDLNRYNFLVRRDDVLLIDFENSRPFDPELAAQELRELPCQLVENTGRGKAR